MKFFLLTLLVVLQIFLAAESGAQSTLPCDGGNFARLLPSTERKALNELRAYLRTNAGSHIGHFLRINADKVVLQIGFLQKRETQLMKLVLRAIGEGSITEIDGGAVVGPKALVALGRLRKFALSRN